MACFSLYHLCSRLPIYAIPPPTPPLLYCTKENRVYLPMNCPRRPPNFSPGKYTDIIKKGLETAFKKDFRLVVCRMWETNTRTLFQLPFPPVPPRHNRPYRSILRCGMRLEDRSERQLVHRYCPHLEVCGA